MNWLKNISTITTTTTTATATATATATFITKNHVSCHLW